jgi:dephospho-CoA kinase
MTLAFRPNPPLVIGILGGVGSGKSSLSALLAEQGLLVLDADREAARVLSSVEMRPILKELFGSEILGPDGPRKDRIASAIFSDPSLRVRLEEAMHPRIREFLIAKMQTGIDSGQSVVLDVPLLIEGGLIARCDRALYLEVPDHLRETRAVARGMSAEDWKRREAAQAPLLEKISHADKTLDNSGSIGDLKAQVLAWLEEESDHSGGGPSYPRDRSGTPE